MWSKSIVVFKTAARELAWCVCCLNLRRVSEAMRGSDNKGGRSLEVGQYQAD